MGSVPRGQSGGGWRCSRPSRLIAPEWGATVVGTFVVVRPETRPTRSDVPAVERTQTGRLAESAFSSWGTPPVRNVNASSLVAATIRRMRIAITAATAAAAVMICAGPAGADDTPAPPPPTPWPTGCDSPLVLGGTPAARKWCGAPLFGPMFPIPDQPPGEQPSPPTP